jgi:REP element-mobilizing transposase RayT
MDNHIHLVIEASSCYSISRIMQSILLSYSRKYRNRYKYVGHLWQGRFISKPIMGEKYILECLEYIHNNPVRAQLIDSPDHYIWSSARFYEKLDNAQVQEYIDIDDYGHFCHN